MKLRRPSVAALMAIVAVVAIDLAIGRALYRRRDYLPVLVAPWDSLPVRVAPMGLVLQAGAFCLFRRPGRRRMFWAGFIVFGGLALGSYICAETFLSVPVCGRAIDFLLENNSPDLETRVWKLWTSYRIYMSHYVNKCNYLQTIANRDDWLGSGFWIITIFVPQLLVALAGGLLGWLVVWVAGFRHLRRTKPSASAS